MRIKIENLSKIYADGHKALNGLNLEIEPGMFGLLGPNAVSYTHLYLAGRSYAFRDTASFSHCEK